MSDSEDDIPSWANDEDILQAERTILQGDAAKFRKQLTKLTLEQRAWLCKTVINSERSCCMRALLDSGVPLDTIIDGDDGDGTLLMHAMATSSPQMAMVSLLLECGASVATATNSGWTVLHRTACMRQPNFMCMFLQRPESKAILNAQTYNRKYAPLHFACIQECPETVQLLVEAGADLNLERRDGETAVTGAIDMHLPFLTVELPMRIANCQAAVRTFSLVYNRHRRDRLSLLGLVDKNVIQHIARNLLWTTRRLSIWEL